MIDHVVLDIETQHLATSPEVGGWANFYKCGVACAVLYEFRTKRMRIFGHTAGDLQALRSRLETAERISGFNIRYFDLPVIYEVPKRTPMPIDGKIDDLFERVLRARGHSLDSSPSMFKGWGLDPICKSTLGTGKIDSGKNAPEMFKTGAIAQLHNYCCDDVALERDLTWFVEQHGFVRNGQQIVFVPPWQSQK